MNELTASLKETHKEKLKLFESLRTFENDREMMRKKERRREDAWKEMLGTAKVDIEKAETKAKQAQTQMDELVPILKEAAASNPKVRDFLLYHKMGTEEELQAIALVAASKASIAKPPMAPLNLTAVDG